MKPSEEGMPVSSREKTNHIVADGHERAFSAALARIREELLRRHAGTLEQAGFWRRWVLRRKIEREARRLACEVAPPDALY